VRTHVEALPLSEATTALARLRAGDVRGALVLVP
jgi:D-arabinose 1-dehydrogenase-like Zn-dependent alcohol dehydrogenase